MKQIHLIATCLIAYTTPSFSAEYHTPGAQTCIGTPLLRQWFAKLQYDARQKELQQQKEQSKKYPKISQEELDRWIAKKTLEINENPARYKRAQEEREWYYRGEYYRKNPLAQKQKYGYSYSDAHYTRIKFATEALLHDHRKTYQSTIKTITCYPPQLLLEWKK